MITFVLIACMNYTHPACISHEFSSYETCEQAGKEWHKVNAPANRVTNRYICVRK
jgi:hypothetical protein